MQPTGLSLARQTGVWALDRCSSAFCSPSQEFRTGALYQKHAEMSR
ncbi:MAG: hypothetical protein OZSIB_1923 [Candidatus Ozemobacter sibiricus]|uniref:Uncharacterized protein n=1 Tax=Candidatus Ozemobacter sibiricus TaxID=2268124 RepID=A0A367ZIQ9_9BACT|nr:MAG: hypothetical protein OZSIB_1923 [Candidatus Ozemobacter sibiricus]